VKLLTIVVFGAAGFVGRNVVEKLIREGERVVASDIAEDPFKGNVTYQKTDVLDREKIFDVVKGGDVVVDLAASPLVSSLEDAVGNMKVNIEGTLNILDASRKWKVRKVIYSSASSVVGNVKYNPVDEEHPCYPKTAYAVAKKACEDYIRVYNETFGLNYLIFRFFNIYGPWQSTRSGALIPNFYQRLRQNQEFQVFGDGSNTRDFTYVGDVADFYYTAIKQDVKNLVVNMGTGRGTSIIELIKLASKTLGVEPRIAYKPSRPGEIGNFEADTRRLVRLFGKKPSTSLEEGLKRTFSWLAAEAS
jgi:UDP-glucose 4-epimerase